MEILDYNEYLKNLNSISRNNNNEIQDILKINYNFERPDNNVKDMPKDEIKMEMKVVSRNTKIEKVLEEILMFNKEPLFFEYLMNQAIRDYDKELIEKIKDIKKLNEKKLQQMYMDITKTKFPAVEEKTDEFYTIDEDYLSNLKKALHNEHSEINIHKQLLSLLNDVKLKKFYNTVLNIILDKLKTADMLNLLIVQNNM